MHNVADRSLRNDFANRKVGFAYMLRITFTKLQLLKYASRNIECSATYQLPITTYPKKMDKPNDQWKKELTPEQYRVLREKGTEAPFTGQLYLNKEKGLYLCAACGNELFTSDMKFDSGCGWPSFDKEIEGGKIIQKRDVSFGMIRTEIMCANCGSHLGHIFDDGPTETGVRYCVNSISMKFKADQ